MLDSSGNSCQVVLSQDQEILAIRNSTELNHGPILLSLINEVMESAHLSLLEIDVLGLVNGPGSFTGLRLGAGVIQGLSVTLNKPVIAVSKLELLAAFGLKHKLAEGLLVAIKARPEEIYFAAFEVIDGRQVRLIGNEQVGGPGELHLDAVAKKLKTWVAVGDGWSEPDKYFAEFNLPTVTVIESYQDDPTALLTLAINKIASGEFLKPEEVLPNYVKERLDYRKA